MADLNELKKEFDIVDKKSNKEIDIAISLKEASYDKKKDEFLCQSNEIVYCFEHYVDFKEKTEKNYNFNGKRFDALHIYKDNIYCIEFKIEKCADINKQEIDGKFIDSFNILKYIFSELNLQIRDYVFNFYVVFKDSKNLSDRHLAIYKKGFKHSFELEDRLVALKKKKFPQLEIEIKADYKSGFSQIYDAIFSTKC